MRVALMLVLAAVAAGSAPPSVMAEEAEPQVVAPPEARAAAGPDADAAEAAPVPAGALLAEAIGRAEMGRWDEAETFAAKTGDPVAERVILWTRLRDGVGRFSEFESFLRDHSDWPGMARLRRQGERHMGPDLADARVIAYFGGEAPQSGTGALRLADALSAQDRAEEAEAVIAAAWLDQSLTSAQVAAFRSRWGEVVDPLLADRLDTLLWRGWTDEAEDLMPLVDADLRALARARIAVRRDTYGLQGLIDAVPAALRGDPGLAYERYLFRVKKSRWDDAEAWILEHSDSAEELGRPDEWMDRRANLARQALARGAVEDAYRIAAGSYGTGGADYADAEWFAGFVALVHKKDPELAATHFRRFGEVVGSPISLGRAGFWLGLALERAGDAEGAQAAYAEGAKHQTSFYGQLAAVRGEIAPDPTLAGEPAPDWRVEPVTESDVVQAARLLIAAEDDVRAMQFLRHVQEGRPAAERAALAQMAIDLDRTHIAVRMAKDAASDGVVIAAQYYPLHPMADETWAIPTELALSIARQESEMNPGVTSHADARGLMQLLPSTARHVADGLGIAYEPARLMNDGLYNASLGTAYLADNIRRFNGSYILAIAAYNAGPGRVSQWVETLGDPRDPDVDPIVWIENIPYSETRNYVMRVMEGLHVYRARLAGVTPPIGLVDDLNRVGSGETN